MYIWRGQGSHPCAKKKRGAITAALIQMSLNIVLNVCFSKYFHKNCRGNFQGA